jgi:hypothetical protein
MPSDRQEMPQRDSRAWVGNRLRTGRLPRIFSPPDFTQFRLKSPKILSHPYDKSAHKCSMKGTMLINGSLPGQRSFAVIVDNAASNSRRSPAKPLSIATLLTDGAFRTEPGQFQVVWTSVAEWVGGNLKTIPLSEVATPGNPGQSRARSRLACAGPTVFELEVARAPLPTRSTEVTGPHSLPCRTTCGTNPSDIESHQFASVAILHEADAGLGDRRRCHRNVDQRPKENSRKKKRTCPHVRKIRGGPSSCQSVSGKGGQCIAQTPFVRLSIVIERNDRIDLHVNPQPAVTHETPFRSRKLHLMTGP